MDTSIMPEKEKEMDECLKETKKGITCDYFERNKITRSTSTKNKGAASYPTDSIESRRTGEPGTI